MEENLLFICIATLSVLILSILYFLKQTNTKYSGKDEVEEIAEPVAPVRPQRAGTARARMRMAQAERQQHERPDVSGESGEEEALADAGIPSGKIGKKKLAKLQLKAEKRAQREVEERERAEKKVEEEKQWELRKMRDEKEKEEEKERAEEEKRKKDEEARKEQEEYEQFKQQFLVQEEGYDEIQDKIQEENLLKDFIEYIKKSKVVVLEELAAMFKLRTQSVINRISKLQEEGRLTGVIDDRGKFIYISREELEKVAKFIRQRGRVSLAEIAEASNQLINLNSEIAVEV